MQNILQTAGGNRMSPTHTNKGGARYRYYVSQAVLQRKPQATASIGRVPAVDIETVVLAALRNQLDANGAAEQSDNDRELLERHLERVTLTSNRLELRLRQCLEAAQAEHGPNNSAGRSIANVTTITVPWTSPVPAAVKGIIRVRVVHHRNGRTNPNSTSSSAPYVFLASRCRFRHPAALAFVWRMPDARSVRASATWGGR
jgi:hypothetical protein